MQPSKLHAVSGLRGDLHLGVDHPVILTGKVHVFFACPLNQSGNCKDEKA